MHLPNDQNTTEDPPKGSLEARSADPSPDMELRMQSSLGISREKAADLDAYLTFALSSRKFSQIKIEERVEQKLRELRDHMQTTFIHASPVQAYEHVLILAYIHKRLERIGYDAIPMQDNLMDLCLRALYWKIVHHVHTKEDLDQKLRLIQADLPPSAQVLVEKYIHCGLYGALVETCRVDARKVLESGAEHGGSNNMAFREQEWNPRTAASKYNEKLEAFKTRMDSVNATFAEKRLILLSGPLYEANFAQAKAIGDEGSVRPACVLAVLFFLAVVYMIVRVILLMISRLLVKIWALFGEHKLEGMEASKKDD